MSSTPKAEDFPSQSTETLNETATLRNALPKTKSKGHHRPRRAWVYGFWVKWRHFRRLSEKYGLDWQNHPVAVSFDIFDHLWAAARVLCRIRGVNYQGKRAMILVFAEDDDRRRLKKNKYSAKQMDRFRKELGLPKGTKPRWFEVDGENYDPDVALESEDEEFPDALDEHPSFRAADRTLRDIADELAMMEEEEA
ncbi:uncharacterized protein FOMMEDRAFT_170293 [Fomitiporia mediterranea MF3/22]|uniref:uncharacterized protein n=1 Tax=Fomitiporia mediterranea (strain MF3/22) TaxID=694068 RepID=UPI0004408FA9|nr:uncharacterized protein FOMMEDRAFT_170293 [Fomitiporia mediterranea MF3/22]EJC99673.1 hypothetical protein FOMMEDRAFT_170293 [Fomitiporia mediterranea MF3/22]